MSWTVTWTSRAHKDLRRMDGQAAARVVTAVDRYARTGSGDVLQLTAIEPPEYRLRVGSWRVRFQREQTSILVLRVLPRDKAY